MSGRVGDLSDEQLTALDTFRLAVDDILRPHHDDYFLLRWLRARNFDVVEAETMLRVSLQWREQVNADAVLDDYEPPEVLKKYYPQGEVGHDKEGCPIWIVPFGNMDLKGLLYSVKKSDFLKYVIYLLEKSEVDMREQTETLGKVIENHTCIFDMAHFSMKQIAWKPAVDIITHLVALYEDNYPERLKKAYVINAPKIFPLAYALVKPFLSEETAKKIHVYSKGTWKAALLEDIDGNELPEHWGGTRVDPDGNPQCPSLVCIGGPVPCSYYMAPSRRLSRDQNLKNITVEKKSFFPVEVTVEEPGSTLQWAFQTENYDIGFGVYYKDNGEDEELLPIQRVNCHLVPEDGIFKCTKPGKYILKFDNTFSWCRSKKLMYEVNVLPPATKSTAPVPVVIEP